MNGVAGARWNYGGIDSYGNQPPRGASVFHGLSAGGEGTTGWNLFRYLVNITNIGTVYATAQFDTIIDSGLHTRPKGLSAGGDNERALTQRLSQGLKMITKDGHEGVGWQYYLWENYGNPTSTRQRLSRLVRRV